MIKRKHIYTLTSGMIQDMIIDCIYADCKSDRQINPEERERIETFLLDLNSLCNKQNGHKIQITIEL